MLDLAALKAMTERGLDLTEAARASSERDRDFYDGYQWTAEERAILSRRKQPVLTINRIRRKIDAMIGIEQRGRVDPRAYPRHPGAEDAADLATKALVFVEEQQRIDTHRSAAFENLLVEGYGGVLVGAEERNGQMDVSIRRLRWEEIVYDPFSREKDFSDAAYLGVVKWMTADAAMEFVAQFGIEAPEDVFEQNPAGMSGETYEDRPRGEGQAWVDKRQRRVRVAEVFYKAAGVWHLAIFTGARELFNDRSPYYDAAGKPCCPIILMSAYVDRENRRYGLVRDLISLQEEINKRRSKLLNLLNARQTMGFKGAVDVATLKRELAMPDGHVEIDPTSALDGAKPFEIIQTADMAAGQFNLLVEAKSEIDMLGPNASLIGQLEGQQSGRAILAQQQAGLAELAPIYDSLRDWTERVYRAIWDRIRQFWTEPRWIRITGDMQAPQFLAVNQIEMTPYGPQMTNAIAEIDVDIIVEQAPDMGTLRAEQFQKLAELAQAGIPIPPQVIIEASDLRDKRKLLEAMAPDPQQAAMDAELAARGAQAQVAGLEARAMRDAAAAQKDMAEIPIRRVEAAVKVMSPRPAA